MTSTRQRSNTKPRRRRSAAVIILHGLGADGNDFVPVAHELELAAVGPVRYVFRTRRRGR